MSRLVLIPLLAIGCVGRIGEISDSGEPAEVPDAAVADSGLPDAGEVPDAGPTVAAAFVDPDFPSELAPGGWTYRGGLSVENRGTTTWDANALELVAVGDAAKLGLPASTPLPAALAPGQRHRFPLTLTSPAQRGQYVLRFGLRELAGASVGQAFEHALSVPRPRIIEFGWATPRTAADLAGTDLARAPIDGAVLDPKLVLANGTERGLSRSVLINEPLTPETLDRDGRTGGLLTGFRRFPDNLLRVNAPNLTGVGWAGDWSTLYGNIEQAARVVTQYGMRGLMFDTELYSGSLTWTQGQGTNDDARARGRELGRRYGALAPNTTIVFTMAHSYVAGQLGVGSHEYDLLAPFIDGMMEGAPESVRFVDGYEISYRFRNRNGAWFPDSYAGGRQNIRGAVSLSAVPDIYARRMKAGFGIWPDFNNQWDPSSFANNFFTPAELQTSVVSAAAASDGWVWIYTQRLHWYVASPVLDGNGAVVYYPLPPEYVSAVAAGR